MEWENIGTSPRNSDVLDSLQTWISGTRGQSLFCDVTMSCDSHGEIPSCIVNIVVAFVDVYGESWLTWLPEVCNHELPVPLLAFIEQ